MHTLLEQEWVVTSETSSYPAVFLTDIFGLKSGPSNYFVLNEGEHIGFFAVDTNVSGTYFALLPKVYSSSSDFVNTITRSYINGSIFYHISENESVKYFKYVPSVEKKYTYILAQDENGEWVIFNGNKMYSDYGATGIYNNFWDGSHSEIVDGGNQFMISQACRLDTGVKCKELYFVLSAKSYSDTNCIVQHGDKKYRLVSVSNVKDETGRYPAFAFPVSDE